MAITTNNSGYAVPPGWMYDAARDGYVNGHGLRVDSFEVLNHGNLVKAIIAIHGAQALMVATGHVSQAAQPYASMGMNQINSAGQLSISNHTTPIGIADVKPTNVRSEEHTSELQSH